MQFQKIALSMRARVEAIRLLAGHRASSHAFSSLFLWGEEKGYEIMLSDEVFLVRGDGFYFFPCGSADGVFKILTDLKNENIPLTFCYAREEDLSAAGAVFGDTLSVVRDESAREYLYDRAEQVAMQGKRFTYQRAKCNKARRLGVIESRPLTRENAELAKAVTLRWAEGRDSLGDTDVTLRAIDLMEELSLFGNLLYLDGEPVGFDLGTMIAPDTLDIHIAKTLRDDVDTLMKLLWYESLPDAVTVINREEDLGIRGLRMHKLDAQPMGYNETYTLTVSA